MVRGDAQKPGTKLRFFAKLAQVLDHAQKGLLSDLLGIKVDLVMKSALKPDIGRRILSEVMPI